MHEVFMSQHFAEQFCQMSAPVLKTLKVMLAHAQQPLPWNETAIKSLSSSSTSDFIDQKMATLVEGPSRSLSA